LGGGELYSPAQVSSHRDKLLIEAFGFLSGLYVATGQNRDESAIEFIDKVITSFKIPNSNLVSAIICLWLKRNRPPSVDCQSQAAQFGRQVVADYIGHFIVVDIKYRPLSSLVAGVNIGCGSFSQFDSGRQSITVKVYPAFTGFWLR
jgi:hypothetical protein